MTTLKDIAAEAGVSIMTVSNVINGKFARVSPQNIEKIQNIAAKLNYTPNSAARSLTTKNSKIIALFIPGEDYKNPHNTECLFSIARTLNRHGYYLMIFSNTNFQINKANLNAWNVDGTISFAPLTDEELHFFESIDKPTCLIDSYHTSSNIIKVGINDYQGGYMAGQYLINCKHKKIGFASYTPSFDKILQYRLEGFQDALKDNGLVLNEEHIFINETTYEGGLRVADEIARSHPDITAIFATEDEMAIGIMNGAAQNNIRVPEELSVMGFDNIPFCDYVHPGLTTISQDINLKGKYAVESLIKLIETNTIEMNDIQIPLSIVERQSVAKL